MTKREAKAIAYNRAAMDLESGLGSGWRFSSNDADNQKVLREMRLIIDMLDCRYMRSGVIDDGMYEDHSDKETPANG